MTRFCGVNGCGKPYHSHGYCARHAYHFKAHGDRLGGRRGASPGEPLRWIEEHARYQGDDCLRWPFEIGRYGYGVVKHNGQKRVASRVMCELAHGPAPEPDMDAAHSCGNGQRACMNPNHLSWKTRTGNVHDAMDHGTWKHGTMDPNAKLNEDDVRDIRRLAATMTRQEIADIYGVSQSHVTRIVNRDQWAWVA